MSKLFYERMLNTSGKSVCLPSSSSFVSSMRPLGQIKVKHWRILEHLFIVVGKKVNRQMPGFNSFDLKVVGFKFVFVKVAFTSIHSVKSKTKLEQPKQNHW